MHSVFDVSAFFGPVGRAVRVTMDTGARMIERQEGYTPARLALGGLVVWGLCLAAMLLGAHASSVASFALRCLSAHHAV